MLFAFGYVVQRCLINLVVNGPIFITLLLTFGLDLLLVKGMNLVFSADYRSIATSYAGNSLALGGVRVPVGRLLAVRAGDRGHGRPRGAVREPHPDRHLDPGHRHGPRRGPADGHPRPARLRAHLRRSPPALAGMAGAMIGTVGTFNPADAGGFTLMSFVVAVLGGLGNMYGALLGGLVIGLVEAWGGQYLPGTWVNALAFLVLVVVLVVRPAGWSAGPSTPPGWRSDGDVHAGRRRGCRPPRRQRR